MPVFVSEFLSEVYSIIQKMAISSGVIEKKTFEIPNMQLAV